MKALQKSITRQELYDEVWRTPVSKLAASWNLPVSAVIRACNELNIPRPGHGYWPSLARGWVIEPDPLPDPEPGTPDSVVIKRAQRKARALPAPSKDAKSHANAEEVAPLPLPKLSGKVTLTRKQLYDAVWSRPATKLSAELGISDVALAKTCRKMNIPCPERGHWARISAGQKIKKLTLPKASENQTGQVTFNIEENLKRREEWSATTPPPKQRAPVEMVSLPDESSALHPRAAKLQALLEKQRPDEFGFVRINQKSAFGADVTVEQIPRLVAASHAIICALEERGLKFADGKPPGGTLRILKGKEFVELWCEESRDKTEREPTLEEKRKPSWTWNLKVVRPTGRLGFRIRGTPSLRGRWWWAESASKSLEEVMGTVVERAELAFDKYELQRKREAEMAARRAEEERLEEERWREEERKRREKERLEKHQRKLESITKQRIENLRTATFRWFESRSILEYVETCEEQWNTQELSEEQRTWLAWARRVAATTHPFCDGYPDPMIDGEFDAGAIEIGGPYPEKRVIAATRKAETTTKASESHAVNQPELAAWQKQYPFWLQHPKR